MTKRNGKDPAFLDTGAGALTGGLAPLAALGENPLNIRLLLRQIRAPVGVVPFVGAGLSVPFGFPAWRPFLEAQAPDEATRQKVVDLLEHGRYEEAAEALLIVRGEEEFQSTLEKTFGEDRLP